MLASVVLIVGFNVTISKYILDKMIFQKDHVKTSSRGSLSKVILPSAINAMC